jgi:hypothetical protein
LAIEPPMVPTLRTIGSPMPPARSASAGMAFCTSAERATVACVVIAPMVTLPPSTLMPFRSAMPPRSTSAFAGRQAQLHGLDQRLAAGQVAASLPLAAAAAAARSPGRW